MSPVQRSLNAILLKRIWNVVRGKVLLQIVAKMIEFPTTATGNNIAITIALQKETTERKLSLFSQLWSE